MYSETGGCEVSDLCWSIMTEQKNQPQKAPRDPATSSVDVSIPPVQFVDPTEDKAPQPQK